MSLYDFPHYYELVFGSDWKAEVEFLRGCFSKHAGRPVRRVFEPACGTGRLLFRLGLAGYQVAGLDLNQHAIEYCNNRFQRYGMPRSAFVGDMTHFRLPHKVDVCFNMINSVRHLMSDEAAKSHLVSVSKCLVRGDLYILGLHLSPTAVAPVAEEAWAARRGHLQVNTRLKAVQRNPRRREERFVMLCDVYTPKRTLHIKEQLTFRSYTARQLQKLLAQVPVLRTAATYDFSYNLKRPIEVSASTEDVVYILQKE